MSNEVIVVNNLVKLFDKKYALNNISFQVNKNEIFGFLGPSGSGKTTTINILTGQLNLDSGHAEMFGNNVNSLSTNLLEKIGIVSDQIGYYEKLTVYKNLEFFSKLYKKSTSHIDLLLQEVDLYKSKDKLVENLSTGMKQRMLLARSLINNPKILFLDEPTSGLDPYTSKKIHKLLLKFRSKGTTIFLTTHDMDEATSLCDNLVLLNNGKIIESGSPTDIIDKYNKDKQLCITYTNKKKKIIPMNLLEEIDTNTVEYIHSCEPTLEDVFIKLTGESLNEKN